MTIKTLNHETAICAYPSPEASPSQQRFAIDKCEELAALVARHTDGKGGGAHATAIDPLVFVRKDDTCTEIQEFCEALLAIVVQGKKKCRSMRKPFTMASLCAFWTLIMKSSTCNVF
ncbi:hypothetical protein [Fischerella sp. PCC 9605]|uniref:hypothetical protein n=1 Tax=Fischerella sp. PCC 9605 TaxID=1173024 RepID=UPI00047905F9|nr:hypothetical protein [Fischerella sp. PCC 9605]